MEEVCSPLQSDLRPLHSPLLRYSLGWRKKCDNRFDGRNSIVYVTLRRNFTCNLTQPRRLPVALSFIVSARCQSLKFRLAIPCLANHSLAIRRLANQRLRLPSKLSSAIYSKPSTGRRLIAASILTMFRIFSSSCRTISRGRGSAKRCGCPSFCTCS